MDDLISRQAAIYAMGKAQWAKDRLMELPSAQPERQKGRWIDHPDWQADGECGFECSECGMGSDTDYPFCMRCGADMREE